MCETEPDYTRRFSFYMFRGHLFPCRDHLGFQQTPAQHPYSPLASATHSPHINPSLQAVWSARGAYSSSTATQPSSTPPDDPSPHRPSDFHRFADLYMGGLWNKLEAEMRQREGDDFDYDVNLTEGCLLVTLPDAANVAICKDSSARRLTVHTNLQDTVGAAEAHREVDFDLTGSGGFSKDGMALHEWLEDSFAKHLKVQFDLKPEIPTIYGADPT